MSISNFNVIPLAIMSIQMIHLVTVISM